MINTNLTSLTLSYLFIGRFVLSLYSSTFDRKLNNDYDVKVVTLSINLRIFITTSDKQFWNCSTFLC